MPGNDVYHGQGPVRGEVGRIIDAKIKLGSTVDRPTRVTIPREKLFLLFEFPDTACKGVHDASHPEVRVHYLCTQMVAMCTECVHSSLEHGRTRIQVSFHLSP